MSPRSLKWKFLRLADEPFDLIFRQAREDRDCQQFRILCHWILAQILMNKLHGHRAFANAGRDTLDGAVAHIAHGKNARHIGFQEEGIALQIPTLGALSIDDQVRASQKKTALVALDHAGEPIGSGQRTNKNKYGTCGNPFNLSSI